MIFLSVLAGLAPSLEVEHHEEEDFAGCQHDAHTSWVPADEPGRFVVFVEA